MSLIPAANFKTKYDYSADIEVMKDFLNKTKGRSISASDLLDENEEGAGLDAQDDDFDVDMDDEDGGSNQRLRYVEQMQLVADREQSKFVIDLEDLRKSRDPEQLRLLENISQNTLRYVQLFYRVIDELLPEPTDPISLRNKYDVLDVIMHQRREKNLMNDEAGEATFPPILTRRYNLYFRAPRSSTTLAVRQVKAVHLGKLISIRGIVTRVSEVKPLLLVNAFSCDACGSEIFQEVESRNLTPLTECPSEECVKNGTKGNLVMQTRACKFEPFQEVKLQEMADQVPVGHIPRSMTLHLYGPLVRSNSPGDVVNVTGIFIPTPYQGFKGVRAGLLTDTYLECHHVSQLRKSYESLEITPEIVSQIEEMANNEHNFYDRLANSIAPEIYGHQDVKKILLLLLIGGVSKEVGDGMKIRGDINVCLMGDPGVAKSQLLKYISKVAPRGVYTTGRGSSGVGLTAAVMRDPVTDEMVLGTLINATEIFEASVDFDKLF
ncbi:Mcm2-7 hexameric complex component [Puccinia graminis f. sp. tritici]|uniref:DNA replication licensing factor MCM7 n=1 Tax=Puccinia graminis f. sp. tritici TaxID=56615 RepID=A0A5B0QL95_PUCGR|nr:Mcm2-7 hexameric complex component [Puccinia graminis f. sp. tritici]